MEDVFTFRQKECLRLLKDYATYFAMDEKYSHECKYHDNKHACELHTFLLKEMDRLKKEAEVCGWTSTVTTIFWKESDKSSKYKIFKKHGDEVDIVAYGWEKK